MKLYIFYHIKYNSFLSLFSKMIHLISTLNIFCPSIPTAKPLLTITVFFSLEKCNCFNRLSIRYITNSILFLLSRRLCKYHSAYEL